MKKYKTGDIVLVRFHPAYGQELKKFRPAVIISPNGNKIDDRFVNIIPFTTQTSVKNEYEIPIQNEDLEKESLLLCWYIQTIDCSRIVDHLGKLKTTDLKLVQTNVNILFS
jgi:mRNA-degrading endonuclease toxin of MazEF toxin-antitoxin module